MGGVVPTTVRPLRRSLVPLVVALVVGCALAVQPADAAVGADERRGEPRPRWDAGPIDPKRLQPSLARLRDSRPASYRDRSSTGTLCHMGMHDRRRPGWCLYGETERYTHTIAMVGASHVAHWLPPMDVIAKRNGWRILYFTANSCDFGLAKGHPSERRCAAHHRRIVPELLAARPDMVFVRANRRDATRPEAGRLPFWRALHARGIPVLAMRDTPLFATAPSECLRRNLRQPLACAQDRSVYLAPTFGRGAAPRNVRILDLTAQYCDDTRCPAVIDGTIVWLDRHHFTREFALRMTDPLERAIGAQWKPRPRSQANDAVVRRITSRSR